MTLETYEEPGDIYLARGEEVNPARPLFTGDIFVDVPIYGVQDNGMAMIVAHPCSMRGAVGAIRPRMLVASVEPHDVISRSAWPRGQFADRMPLPSLLEDGFYVGRLDALGNGDQEHLTSRVACLSAFGINLLQQRMVWHLTRTEIPTRQFHEAFAHTLEEADLLEEWNDIICSTGMSEEDAAAEFEKFIRSDDGSGRTRQEDLREPQRRSSVRSACRTEAHRLAEAQA